MMDADDAVIYNKKRQQPFTGYEKEVLKELVMAKAAILESRKTDSDFTKKKNVIWDKVAAEFSSTPQCREANPQQLKKLWLNMKARAREAKTITKQRSYTGGGPHIPDPDPEDELLSSMLPSIMPTIKVPDDSDGQGENNGDDDSEIWLAKKTRIQLDDSEPIAKKSRIHVPEPGLSQVTPNKPQSQSVLNQECESARAKLSKLQTQQQPVQNKSTPTSIIDTLKAELIEKDINQRQQKFEQSMAHDKRVDDLSYAILQMEYEHKKEYYRLVIKEQQARVRAAESELIRSGTDEAN